MGKSITATFPRIICSSGGTAAVDFGAARQIIAI
jgi:hypothetical protein